MQQISASVYQLTHQNFVNFYLIVQSSKVTVIDTGLNPTAITQLEKALQTLGLGMDAIQAILITHAHYDHLGGLYALQQRTNAHTYAHRLEAPIVRGQAAPVYAQASELGLSRFLLGFVNDNRHITPARVDTELKGDETLLGNLEVLLLSGHSHGQIGFYLRDEGVLIGGDVMMNLPVLGLIPPLRMTCPDWQAVKASIQRVHDLNPPLLCLGHGAVLKDNLQAKIQAVLRKL